MRPRRLTARCSLRPSRPPFATGAPPSDYDGTTSLSGRHHDEQHRNHRRPRQLAHDRPAQHRNVDLARAVAARSDWATRSRRPCPHACCSPRSSCRRASASYLPCRRVRNTLLYIASGTLDASGTGIASVDAPATLYAGDALRFGPEGDGVVVNTAASPCARWSRSRDPRTEARRASRSKRRGDRALCRSTDRVMRSRSRSAWRRSRRAHRSW